MMQLEAEKFDLGEKLKRQKYDVSVDVINFTQQHRKYDYTVNMGFVYFIFVAKIMII